MATISIRELIDLAIGSPDPGHVNFYALHCLLYSLADQLNIINKTVDCSKYTNDYMVFTTIGKDVVKNRITGGADPEAEVEPEVEGDGEEVEEEKPEGEEHRAFQTVAASSNKLVDETNVGHQAEEVEKPPVAEPQPKALAVVEQPSQIAQPSPAKPDEPVSSERALKIKSSKDNLLSPSRMRVSIDKLHSRVSLIEHTIGGKDNSNMLMQGLAIMKDQIELAMEQVHKLTVLTLRGKSDRHKINQLRGIEKKLRSIQRDNIYIEGRDRNLLDDELSTSGEIEEGLIEEIPDEGSEEGMEGTENALPPTENLAEDQYELDMHLCYSPEKILDQVMDLKSEFCLLSNKVNELSAMQLANDSQRTTVLLVELQDITREQMLFIRNLRAEIDQLDLKQMSTANAVDLTARKVQDIMEDKIDRSEVIVLLADKVDYSQLQRKVSKEQMQELQCRVERQFCELQKCINLSERNMMQAMEVMKKSLGVHVIEEMLNKFKEKIDNEVAEIRDKLHKYMEDTNDDCAAGAARIKVLQDLACLSCDTTCVMRTIEKSKVAKLPSAKASNLLSPLVTYELGSIRKSGIMGYYRKDEFPHAPHAWLDRNVASMKACVPRHAGGPHTSYTAKEHVEKVLLNKK